MWVLLFFLPLSILAGPSAVEPSPESTDLRAEAERLYETVELEAAADLYRQVVETEPDNADLRLRLAECLTRTDQFQEAIVQSTRAVELTGGEPRAKAILGMAFYRKGDFEASEKQLRAALEIDPDCASCLWGLARLEEIHGEPDAAAHDFRAAAALEPDNPIFLRSLAPFVSDPDERRGLYRRYLKLPRRDELRVWKNNQAWLAVLDHLGDRRPNQVEIPDEGTEVRLREQGGLNLVSVTVGSRKNQRYLFDTGASGFTVSSGLVKRLKLEPVAAYTITGIGGEGTREVKMVVVDEVRVGEAVVRNVPAVVSDALSQVEGLIGPTLFGRARLTLDRKRMRLRIGGLGEGGSSAVARDEGKGKKRKRPRGEAVEVPFLNINGTPFIAVTVDGITMHAMVDTGASRSVLSNFAVDQVPGLELMAPGLGSIAPGAMRGVTGAWENVRLVRRAWLEFAGRRFEMSSLASDGERVLVSHDLTSLSHALETEVWAILGNPQLDNFSFSIDWERQMLRMTPVR